MASLTPQHRRSRRTRREPKRFTDEKFVSGRVDQYTRGYSGWQEDNWLNKYQDAENYYHDHRNKKFGTDLYVEDCDEELLDQHVSYSTFQP